MTDEESIAHQTAEWVAGRPWHNTVRDECCPDFSCCAPDMLWPAAQREVFAKADRQTQERMMFGALSGLVGSTSVHVVDPDAHESEVH